MLRSGCSSLELGVVFVTFYFIQLSSSRGWLYTSCTESLIPLIIIGRISSSIEYLSSSTDLLLFQILSLLFRANEGEGRRTGDTKATDDEKNGEEASNPYI